MTNTRMGEIERTAEEIVSHSRDLQTAVLHHPEVSRMSGDNVHDKLRQIIDLAGTLMRKENRGKLDPVEPVRIRLINGLNCMGIMLKKNVLDGGLNNLDDSDLLKIRNMAAELKNRADQYFCVKRKEENSDAAA